MSFFDASKDQFSIIHFKFYSVMVVVGEDSFFYMHTIECLANMNTLYPSLGNFVVLPAFVVSLYQLGDKPFKVLGYVIMVLCFGPAHILLLNDYNILLK